MKVLPGQSSKKRINRNLVFLFFFFVHSSSIMWPDEQKVSINSTQLKLCYHDRPICSWTDQCRDNSRSRRHARWFTPLCPDAYSSSSRNTFFIRFKINVQYEVRLKKKNRLKKKIKCSPVKRNTLSLNQQFVF